MNPLLKIGNQDNGERLDAVLARTYPRYSRVFFQKFMKKGGVTLAGTPREPSYRVRVGEVFQVADFEHFTSEEVRVLRALAPNTVVPNVLFEDPALLVIDKPAGLVVHPAPGHRIGTLVDWLKNHLGSGITKVFTDPERLGLVHRLDKDTSGVLLIAKSIISQTAISRQFRDRTVVKTYTAFVEGVPAAKKGVINAPIGRSRKAATRMAVTPLGRESETTFEVKESLGEVAQVTLFPKTGRTHQLRVHLAAIGHTIVGDRTYGSKSIWAERYNIQRPMLHAEYLEIQHPLTEKRMTFHAPWPEDMKRAQERFRNALKVVLAVLCLGVSGYSGAAPESTPTKRTTSAASSEATAARKAASRNASRISELTADVKSLKAELAEMQASFDALKNELDRADLAGRLKDLEKVAAELNSRAVSGTSSTEETKTQLMDISRRLKGQQEALEQLKDLVDRVNRQIIRQKAVETPSESAPAGSQAP